MRRKVDEYIYLGQGHVRNDHHVQGGWRVLLDVGVTARVILVWAGASVLFPGLAAFGLGDRSLR